MGTLIGGIIGVGVGLVSAGSVGRLAVKIGTSFLKVGKQKPFLEN